jgi:hypothetical protein
MNAQCENMEPSEYPEKRFQIMSPVMLHDSARGWCLVCSYGHIVILVEIFVVNEVGMLSRRRLTKGSVAVDLQCHEMGRSLRKYCYA